MSRPAHRRKTDRPPPDRAALAEARLYRVSTEIRRGCDRFWRDRGLVDPGASTAFNPFDGISTRSDDSNASGSILAQTAGMPAPTGGIGKLERNAS